MVEGAPASESAYQTPVLEPYLSALSRLHPRVCPRQVLGVRIGLEAGALLEVAVPRSDKRLIALVETDGCFADGIAVATGCWLGRRTLRLVDYGKVAATIVDTRTGRAFRLWPHPAARVRASDYAPAARSLWHAQLAAYQIMPAEQLLRVQPVELETSVQHLVGQPGRVACTQCGEDVLNGRERKDTDGIRCLMCADGHPYYRELSQSSRQAPAVSRE